MDQIFPLYLNRRFYILFLFYHVFILWILAYLCGIFSSRCGQMPSSGGVLQVHSCSVGILKISANFTRKYLCRSLFFNKESCKPPAFYFTKRDSNSDVFLWTLQIFLKHLFWGLSPNFASNFRLSWIESVYLYSPWNHQKTRSFLIILGGMEVNSLKFVK